MRKHKLNIFIIVSCLLLTACGTFVSSSNFILKKVQIDDYENLKIKIKSFAISIEYTCIDRKQNYTGDLLCKNKKDSLRNANLYVKKLGEDVHISIGDSVTGFSAPESNRTVSHAYLENKFITLVLSSYKSKYEIEAFIEIGGGHGITEKINF